MSICLANIEAQINEVDALRAIYDGDDSVSLEETLHYSQLSEIVLSNRCDTLVLPSMVVKLKV